MTDLAEWLLAQIAEDEDVARAAGHRLRFDVKGPNRWSVRGNEVRDANGDMMVKWTWPDEAAHIARHDPARVLAECAAKRQIVELHDDQHECASGREAWDYPYVGCLTLRLLALPYANHDGYREEWRP